MVIWMFYWLNPLLSMIIYALFGDQFANNCLFTRKGMFTVARVHIALVKDYMMAPYRLDDNNFYC